MHVPDGFLDLPTSLATGAVAAGAIGLALRRSERELAASGPALPGLVAAFVFAAQMVNFPVGAGTSGHLLGATLAAVLVGPWTGLICMSVVLLVQALLFADGGLTALGTNITLMGVVGVLVGYGATRLALAATKRWRAGPVAVVPAAALGALVSVPAAALTFVGLYAVGGAVPIPLPALTAAMLGWHAVIGLGEAVITAAVLSAVVAVRPDLVYAVRDRRAALRLDGEPESAPTGGAAAPAGGAAVPAGATAVATGPASGRAPRGRGLFGLALSVTLLVAGLLALAASAHPDGLEFVAGALGFEAAARDSVTAGSPLADYGVAGLGAWGTSLAGVVGVTVTLAVARLLLAARRRAAGASAPERQRTRVG